MSSSVRSLLFAVSGYVENTRQVLELADELARAVGGGRARTQVANLRATLSRLESTLLTEHAVVAAALDDQQAAHHER
ncbi:hypothetical protein ABIA39_004514 [Nocardia sp. GAS34]|uniref:hypothetical protein n=1 Tax=unclassified Nocardia TaxID=2637762 RepID=UPI003D22AD5E